LSSGIAIPAKLVYPRFAGLNPGYLAQSVEAGRQYGLYASDPTGYDPAIPFDDFLLEGTVAVGELATLVCCFILARFSKQEVIAYVYETTNAYYSSFMASVQQTPTPALFSSSLVSRTQSAATGPLAQIAVPDQVQFPRSRASSFPTRKTLLI